RHFASSTTSGSASLISVRLWSTSSVRQSLAVRVILSRRRRTEGVTGAAISEALGQDKRVGDDVVTSARDDGCTRNPGPGGWGAVLRYGEHARELYGGEAGETTNNRMELTATIMALEVMKRPLVVNLHTDSTYVRNGITKWVAG